jgi:hypothetical protein
LNIDAGGIRGGDEGFIDSEWRIGRSLGHTSMMLVMIECSISQGWVVKLQMSAKECNHNKAMSGGVVHE